MSSNISTTQPSWSKNPSSRGAGVPPGSAAAMRASARWMPGDPGLGTGPAALTKARLPVAVLKRAATPGEKPPGWVTASTTGPPSRCSTACRNPAGTTGHASRIPAPGGGPSAPASSQPDGPPPVLLIRS